MEKKIEHNHWTPEAALKELEASGRDGIVCKCIFSGKYGVYYMD